MSRKMKDSRVEWIGLIPEEWNIVKVKRKFKYSKEIVGEKEKDFERLALTLKGVIKRPKNDSEGLQPEKFESYQIIRKNDLVFKLIDLENVRTSRVGLSPYEGIVSPAYIKLTNPKESRFGYYFFITLWYHEVFNNIGGNGVRSNLTSNDLLNLPYIDVPYNEQQKIANFLDEKVSQIDTIIEKTKQSIEELKKYKQSLITETVTKGLNPDVEMKDTGINWLGNIPIHWKVSKIRNIFEIKKDIANKLGYNVLSVTQQGLKIKDIESNEGQLSSDYSKYQIVEINDFVMNHMDLLTGWVDCSKYVGVTSPDYRVFRFKNNINYNHDYFKYLLQVCYLNRIFYAYGHGVSNLGRWRLPTDEFLNFYVPVPNVDEQDKIADFLNKKLEIIDRLVRKKEEMVKEMEKYKKSLIYEYVTGKKEVM